VLPSGAYADIREELIVKISRWLAVLAAMAVFAGTDAHAQEQPDLRKMAEGIKRNQEALRHYTWDSKIVFEVDGVQKRSDLYSVRYVMGGMMEKMQISSEVDKKKVRRPDGKKLSKKERETAREFVMEAKRQLDAYLSPLFAEKAVATALVTTEEGTLRLQSHDVVRTGDSVQINIVQATRQPMTLEVTTTIGDSPVKLEVGFESLDYGPNYPARSITTTVWEGIKLVIITENSNYLKQKE
jgi:hypothetical protein